MNHFVTSSVLAQTPCEKCFSRTHFVKKIYCHGLTDQFPKHSIKGVFWLILRSFAVHRVGKDHNNLIANSFLKKHLGGISTVVEAKTGCDIAVVFLITKPLAFFLEGQNTLQTQNIILPFGRISSLKTLHNVCHSL